MAGHRSVAARRAGKRRDRPLSAKQRAVVRRFLVRALPFRAGAVTRDHARRTAVPRAGGALRRSPRYADNDRGSAGCTALAAGAGDEAAACQRIGDGDGRPSVQHGSRSPRTALRHLSKRDGRRECRGAGSAVLASAKLVCATATTPKATALGMYGSGLPADSRTSANHYPPCSGQRSGAAFMQKVRDFPAGAMHAHAGQSATGAAA